MLLRADWFAHRAIWLEVVVVLFVAGAIDLVLST